jgi:hypothetical protein
MTTLMPRPTPVLVDVSTYITENGVLVVPPAALFLPEIRRVFCVIAGDGNIRGEHAHRECSQFMVAISGTVGITCTNGKESFEFKLSTPERGLFVPPMIWATQTYVSQLSVLTVICDKEFSEDDYIREFDLFTETCAKLDPASAEGL